ISPLPHRTVSGSKTCPGGRASALNVLRCDQLLALWPPCGMVPVTVGRAASSLLDLGRGRECPMSARVALECCRSLELVWPLDCWRIFRNSACIRRSLGLGWFVQPTQRRSRTNVVSGLLSSHGKIQAGRLPREVSWVVQRHRTYGRPEP